MKPLKTGLKTTVYPIGRGVFGADMAVSLVNDGPVTIIIDTNGSASQCTLFNL